MDRYTFFYKSLSRINSYLRMGTKRIDSTMKSRLSRLEAKRLVKLHVLQNERKIVDRDLKNRIKEYCHERFGDPSYWPWLAVYSEIRGEYVDGWIPYDYFRFQMIPKLNTGPRLSDFKTYDYQLFRKFSVKPYFLKISGLFYDCNLNQVEISEVRNFFNNLNKEVVIKYDTGSGGKNIQFTHSSSSITDDIKMHDNVLLQPALKQSVELDNLCSESVNTLRVMTQIKENGEIVKKFAILRFGIGGSRVDNLTTGGGFVPLFDNGKPMKNAYDINGFDLGEKHPQSGLRFVDLNVPSFQKSIDLCKKYHLKFPYQRLISWDICIEQGGEPRLIEWNTGNQYFFVPETILGPFWPKNLKDT